MDMMGLEVIIYHNDAILLEVLLKSLFLHDTHRFGRRNILPPPSIFFLVVSA
jgi:hypothetical protein